MVVDRSGSEACLGEDDILAFAEGNLAANAVAALEAHTRLCDSCRELLTLALGAIHGAAPRTTPLPVSRGVSIGRYLVLGQVGSGGMGDVFAAYDPQLDRKIALKLLRARGEARGERGRERLLREAKAIAKLSHPNVVVVYDAGTFDERVFVAMEFVEGQTLAGWLAERPRTQKEILTVFAAAGRGLGAAHASGLVHRDFKPQNVMVGADGQVRVMDFGLARAIAEETAETTEDAVAVADPTQPASPPDSVALTLTGELVGTPLFMAPEQFQGRRTDARTDQFGFCVALYQALYGAHPFRCTSLKELMTGVLDGVVQAPPAKSTVPTWLRRVLLRGLSVNPCDRWPSMDALHDALARDPVAARRRSLFVTAAVAVAVVAGAGLWRAGRRAERLCQAGGERLAGLWEPAGAGPSHDRMRAAFLSTGLAYAADTWDRTRSALDRYASRWLDSYRDACEATHARGEQSAQVLDLRMTCLDERLTGLRSLTDVLAVANADTVARAVDAATALPSLDRCSDVKQLRESADPPRDEAARARVEAIRKRAAVVDAMNLTGKHTEALELGRTLIAETRAVQSPPLLADLLYRLWSFGASATFPNDAIKDLEEAVWLALASRRDDVAGHAAVMLSGLTGHTLARRADGERWAALATAILDRLGPGHDLSRAWLQQNQSGTALLVGNLDEALSHARQALALKQGVLPPGSPDLADSLSSLAEALYRRGDLAEALATNARAYAVYASAYGEGSPWMGRVLSNRGEYLVAAGKLAEGLASFEKALLHWEPRLGPDHPFLGYPLTGLGVALWKAGRPDEALPLLERALRIRETHERDAGAVAETRLALGRVLWDLDLDAGRDRARARQLVEQARDVYAGPRANTRPALDARTWLSEHAAVEATRTVSARAGRAPQR